MSNADAYPPVKAANGPFPAFTRIAREVFVERQMQDDHWGGPAHDDKHGPVDWLDLVNQQIDKAALAADGVDGPITRIQEMQLVRLRLVRIAALAVAGMQSIDRLRAKISGEPG